MKLQQAVDWQPGQLVAVTTSIWKDEYNNQNEVMTVDFVKDAGRTVVFKERFQYMHYGWVGWLMAGCLAGEAPAAVLHSAPAWQCCEVELPAGVEVLCMVHGVMVLPCTTAV